MLHYFVTVCIHQSSRRCHCSLTSPKAMWPTIYIIIISTALRVIREKHFTCIISRKLLWICKTWNLLLRLNLYSHCACEIRQLRILFNEICKWCAHSRSKPHQSFQLISIYSIWSYWKFLEIHSKLLVEYSVFKALEAPYVPNDPCLYNSFLTQPTFSPNDQFIQHITKQASLAQTLHWF